MCCFWGGGGGGGGVGGSSLYRLYRYLRFQMIGFSFVLVKNRESILTNLVVNAVSF